LRGDKDAYLHGLVERRGDTVGSWTFSKGWVEEWVVEESGDVIRETRTSPSRDGWKLVALGIRDVDIEGLGHWKEVVEVWSRGEESREDGMRKAGIPPWMVEGYRWLL
jgi:hypothetical protein